MTIICLIGPSGSGKSTIANELETFGIPQIISYTTRPMRPGEEQGVGHHFITDSEAEELLRTQRPLAYTVFGGYRYFALFSQIKFTDRKNDILTYVIDEEGYFDLHGELEANANRLHYEYGFPMTDPVQLLPISIDRANVTNVDAHRMARDIDRIQLPAGTFKICIDNDAPDAASLRAWAKDFAEAIRAYLTICTPNQMPPAEHTIRTSEKGVALIIAAINNALHRQ